MTHINGIARDPELNNRLLRAIDCIVQTGHMPPWLEEKFYSSEGFEQTRSYILAERKNIESALRVASDKLLHRLCHEYGPRHFTHSVSADRVHTLRYTGKDESFPIESLTYRAKQSIALKLFRMYDKAEDILDAAGIEVMVKTDESDCIEDIIQKERTLCEQVMGIITRCSFLRPYPLTRTYSVGDHTLKGVHQLMQSDYNQAYIDILQAPNRASQAYFLSELLRNVDTRQVRLKGTDASFAYTTEDMHGMWMQVGRLFVNLLSPKEGQKKRDFTSTARNIAATCRSKYRDKIKKFSKSLPSGYRLHDIIFSDTFLPEHISACDDQRTITIYKYDDMSSADQHLLHSIFSHNPEIREISVEGCEHCYQIRRGKIINYLIQDCSRVISVNGSPRVNIDKFIGTLRDAARKISSLDQLVLDYRLSHADLPPGHFALNSNANYQFRNRNRWIRNIPPKRPLIVNRYAVPKEDPRGAKYGIYRDLQTFMTLHPHHLVVEIQVKGVKTHNINEMGSLNHERYKQEQRKKLLSNPEAYLLVQAIDSGMLDKNKQFEIELNSINSQFSETLGMILDSKEMDDIEAGGQLLTELIKKLDKYDTSVKQRYMSWIAMFPKRLVLGHASRSPLELLTQGLYLTDMFRSAGYESPAEDELTAIAYEETFKRVHNQVSHAQTYTEAIDIFREHIGPYCAMYAEVMDMGLPDQYCQRTREIAGKLSDVLKKSMTNIAANIPLHELFDTEDLFDTLAFETVSEQLTQVSLPPVDYTAIEKDILGIYHHRLFDLTRDMVRTVKPEDKHDILLSCYFLNYLQNLDRKIDVPSLSHYPKYWTFLDTHTSCMGNCVIPIQTNKHYFRRMLRRVDLMEFQSHVRSRINRDIDITWLFTQLKSACEKSY